MLYTFAGDVHSLRHATLRPTLQPSASRYVYSMAGPGGYYAARGTAAACSESPISD